MQVLLTTLSEAHLIAAHPASSFHVLQLALYASNFSQGSKVQNLPRGLIWDQIAKSWTRLVM